MSEKDIIDEKNKSILTNTNTDTTNTDTTTTDLTNILNKQKEIIDAINSVSKRLACYKAYTGGTNLVQDNIVDNAVDLNDYCPYIPSDQAGWSNYKSELDASVNAIYNVTYNTGLLKEYQEALKIFIDNNSSRFTRDDNYNITGVDTTIEEVLNKHNNLEKKRGNLKSILNELKSEKGTNSRESELYLDSTVYASILWTTVATSLLYYVFTSL